MKGREGERTKGGVRESNEENRTFSCTASIQSKAASHATLYCERTIAQLPKGREGGGGGEDGAIGGGKVLNETGEVEVEGGAGEEEERNLAKGSNSSSTSTSSSTSSSFFRNFSAISVSSPFPREGERERMEPDDGVRRVGDWETRGEGERGART